MQGGASHQCRGARHVGRARATGSRITEQGAHARRLLQGRPGRCKAQSKSRRLARRQGRVGRVTAEGLAVAAGRDAKGDAQLLAHRRTAAPVPPVMAEMRSTGRSVGLLEQFPELAARAARSTTASVRSRSPGGSGESGCVCSSRRPQPSQLGRSVDAGSPAPRSGRRRWRPPNRGRSDNAQAQLEARGDTGRGQDDPRDGFAARLGTPIVSAVDAGSGRRLTLGRRWCPHVLTSS
jgi:hypothetical protein